MDLNNLSLLGVEIATAVFGLLLLVIGMIIPKTSKSSLGYLTAFGFLGILGLTFAYKGANQNILDGMYNIDDYSVFFKQLFLVAGALVSFASFRYVRDLEENVGEYFVMMVFATLGMMIMASAGDFITIYLALELMTISFYILTGYKKGDSRSLEAGVKYVLLGALSSAVLLYGMSLVYGLTGTTVISQVAEKISGDVSPALLLALIFLIAGFGFKISLVPFHMWSPDVYQGAPTPTTSFLAVGSKAAAFAAMGRIFIQALSENQALKDQWVLLFAVLAALTMVIGNLVAIPQTNIKRMLAYSSVAQAGYIMTGMIAATAAGIKGVAFYAMLYVFATVGAFTVVITFSNITGSDEIKDYSGLAQRNPLMAAVLTACLLSMAGIPPLAGFVGKFYLFSALVSVANGKFLWLAIVGFVMSMVSVYYYLSVAKVMYMGDVTDETPITTSSAVKFALLATLLITVFIGVYPAPLSDMANAAAAVLFP